MIKRFKLVLPFALGLVLTLAVAKLASWGTPTTAPQSMNSGQHFLPPYANARDRFGFDSGPLTGYDVAQLHAGWYSNWGALLDPDHPDQLVFAQLIRFTAGSDSGDPTMVTAGPDKAMIAIIAAANPGSLWILGNEPDSFYQGNPILPDVYAHVYHEYYQYIKSVDPNAIIANGGIVQPTPCRLAYLDIVFDTYEEHYGEPMPVDVWNIHAFTLREVYGQWGASTPPGVDPSCGIDYAVDDADDVELFLDNIRAMRAWMKDRGYQEKPLIVSEYGILWPTWFAPQFTPTRVSHFMTKTFDLFLSEKDLGTGCPADDYRPVQAWAWYSLSDDDQYNGYLFYSDSKTLSPMGEVYAAYTAAISDPLYTDLSARLVAELPDLAPTSDQMDGTGPLSVTAELRGSASNLGKLPAPDALARFEVLPEGNDGSVLGNDERFTAPVRFDGVVVFPSMTVTLTAPGRHVLSLDLDPEASIDDPRRWNNAATTTLDMRPDLVSLDLDYQLPDSLFKSGSLTVTATIGNRGTWSSPAASATAYLESWPIGTRLQTRTISIPPLPTGALNSQVAELAWLPPENELYRLVLELDEEGSVSELHEDNNEDEVLIPISLSTTVVPTTTTVLTSASGAISFVFPPGTVTTATRMLFTPLWPGDWSAAGIELGTVAFSLTAILEDRPAPLTFAQPVTITWQYSEADVTVLPELEMRLFGLEDDGTWNDAACKAYQRDPIQNRLKTAICRTGRFAYGSNYELFLPVIVGNDSPTGSRSEQATPAPGSRHSPLLLP